MREITVRTNGELKKAMENNCNIIYVEGELAEKIKKTEQLKKLGTVALTGVIGAIIIACGTAPITGGMSFAAASAVVAATFAATGVTLSTSAIIAIVAIGAGLILTMYKDYDIEIEVDNNGTVRVKLIRKK